MKNLKKLAFIALGIIALSCSKEDRPALGEPVLATLQDPLAGYLAASGFSQNTTSQVYLVTQEFGYSFIPLVDGKITAIVAKLPTVHLGLRVTIWDKATATALRTESIDVATADVEVIKQITALDLVKNKEYFITMNSISYYFHSKTDGSNASYPFTVGDIKIMSFASNYVTSQTMPTSIFNFCFFGDCSFKFQK